MSGPTNAQLRTQVEELTQQLAGVTARADRAETAVMHADSFTFRLPNPRAYIHVQANGAAHWGVFLNEPARSAVWDGSAWGPTNIDFADLYQLTQTQAVAIAGEQAAAAWADHDGYIAERPAPAGPVKDEFLSEFEPEVAA